MEFPILNFTSIFSLFLFLFVLHKIMITKIDTSSKLPPGPWKIPVIGNIHNLVGSLPHRKLRDLSKKYGPLMHLKLGEVSAIVISSPEYAKEVLKTNDIVFASRPPILASKILSYDSIGISFAPYGDYWRQLRKICMLELLSSKRVHSFQPIRIEELTNLIRWITSKEGSTINLTKEVASTIATVASRTAFGKKCKYHKEFISVVNEGLEAAGGFDLGDLFPSKTWLQHVSGLKPRLEKLHQQADLIMQNIINEHRLEVKSKGEEEKEDLIDVLLKFQDTSQQEFHLTDDSIKAVILDVFGGGSETSSSTAVWAMAEMIKNQRVMEKVQAEVREVFDKEGKANESGIENLKYLKYVVKETLRLHPPGPLLLPRECGQACEINGYHIPIKSKVIVNAWAIGRDPNHWNEPERFYPERFIESSIDYKGTNFEFIPFGAGRRMCPGINFGLLNVEFALALLVYHFDWKLPNSVKNEDLDMTETFGSAVRRKDDLYLIPVTCRPLHTAQAL